MFHGCVDEDTITAESCEVYRNAFVEPMVMYPLLMLLVEHDLAERLRPLTRAQFRRAIDAYVFDVPYRLGHVPDYLDPIQADLERVMLAKDEILLPRAKTVRRAYTAVEPTPIRMLPTAKRVDVEARPPYMNEPDTCTFLSEPSVIDEFGMVATGFGLQISEPVYEVLEPHIRLPYFRVLTLQI